MSPFCHSCQILSFFCHFTTVFVLSFWMFCHFCQFSSFCHFCQFCQFLLLWSFLSFLKKFNSRSALKFIFNLVVDKASIWNTHLEQLRLALFWNVIYKHRILTFLQLLMEKKPSKNSFRILISILQHLRFKKAAVKRDNHVRWDILLAKSDRCQHRRLQIQIRDECCKSFLFLFPFFEIV